MVAGCFSQAMSAKLLLPSQEAQMASHNNNAAVNMRTVDNLIANLVISDAINWLILSGDLSDANVSNIG